MSADLRIINPHRVNASIVELLEDALVLAREGKIINGCFAGEMSDNSVWSGFSGKPTCTLIGETIVQTQEMAAALRESRNQQ